MIVRKYCALFSSTCPWLLLCIICWWLDRLFMELGHRRTDSTFCYHNNLQYVNMHCIVTILAVIGQSIHSSYQRREHFRRETVLLGTKPACIFHLYLLQFVICCMWTVIFACIVDVSPWLCFDTIVLKRASITAFAMGMLCFSVYLEQFLYNRALVSNVRLVEI